MGFNYADGIPKGKIVPMFLSDEEDLYTIHFHSMEELEMMGELIAGLLGHTVAIDIEHPVNDLKDKLVIYEKSTKKKR